ncbi:MAG TPA: heavy metal translocating P-type ATPase [Mobilitalea sp.]|nr:heavy metal translocating P-type ATPase [Mobilitalea sp.]
MRRRLWRIIIGSVVLLAASLIKMNIPWLQPVLFLVSYIIIGGDVVLRAVRNIIRGKVFDENFLMTLATIGAFFIREFSEGIAVMLFYQIGELFQSFAVNRSRKSIASLMDIRPDYANVKKGEELIRMDPEEVAIGDIIVIKAGEKIPLDAIIVEGSSMLDTSALTGESIPHDVEVGDDILSGSININGVITAEVTKEFGESTVSKILDLVENASSKKSNSEQFITKFARYYTPIVVIVAAFLAVIPPLIMVGATFSDWIYRALQFLVVSCPCALVISIPLSFFGGIGAASRKGILIKGSNYLEALAQAEIIVFDKTGTLTKGVFNVQEINAKGVSQEELLELTAYAESYSNHPISISLKRTYGKEIDNTRISDIEEISGHGVIATVDGKRIMAGNIKLMNKLLIPYDSVGLIGTVVHVAVDGKYAGYILIADEIKEDSVLTIKKLKAAYIKLTVMLTGDSRNVATKVADDLGLDKVYSELLPGDKVDKLEELFLEKSIKGKLAFVGDGINDAPVLARADIGIAMGGLGSDAAIEAADIVIMTDEPSKIVTAIKISQRTLRIAHQNIYFAIGIKVIVLILSAFGYATMWAAVFADVGVTIIAILNSFRALRVKA